MFHLTWMGDGAADDSGNVVSTTNQYPLQPCNLYDLIFAPPHGDEESRLRSWKRKNNGVVVQIREHKKTITDRCPVSITFSSQHGSWVLRSNIRKRTVITRKKIWVRPRPNGEMIGVSTISDVVTNPM
jgi:hypothetical protein